MDRSEFSKGISTFFLLILISAGLLVLDNCGLLVRQRALSSNLILPTQRAFLLTGQGFTNFFSFLTFWKSGSSKITYLEQRVRELTVEAEKVKRLEDENVSLRSQVGVPVSKNKRMVMGSVVGNSQNLLIDKGLRDGIKTGMPVIYQDVLIGKLVKVLENSSSVLVLTDPLSRVTATTSKTKAKGIVAGQFGVETILEKVVSEDVLNVGDVILTSGEDGILKGLIIGKISEVQKLDAGVFQSAKISLVLDFQKLNQVFVVIGE